MSSFIGLVNYYARFQPNLAHRMTPLYNLIKKDVPFKWSVSQESAFNTIKDNLSRETLLVHFDPAAEVILTCDASPSGVGGVLQERDSDGKVKPVAFVSRSLNKAEKHYAQIEREALSIVFSAENLLHFLLGRHFTLETDHKPLLVFGEHKGIPEMASARIKRWAMKLSAFDYSIKYITSKANACADFLSRCPLPVTETSVNKDDQVLNINENNVPITASAIASETTRDLVLAKVRRLTLEGWPEFMKDEELQPYF